MQHWKKGPFFWLLSFTALKPYQIGNESLLRNIVKQIAPCWTRNIYRYPPLESLIWTHWRNNQPDDIMMSTPETIPKRFAKIVTIADDIILKNAIFVNEVSTPELKTRPF